ncbi:Kdo hydroxylase family protein [Candidatus Sodalis endolongispinus]|uniref:Kdo hydroxylase family protein n=1 Tax=Candidatus Sodalis endolongispinus TaxID=2812662 RepID=A0ABS5YFM7_9GAMM|nr:Kdo hydroxylase family protein [Candidatus Sodalis endolongispinus]MBT9432836.1 Kdo hydroxylase family protein [Candidatus Sodalis endolongispinus]
MSEIRLTRERAVTTLPHSRWGNAGEAPVSAVDALEQGRVVFFPHLAFTLTSEELTLLPPALAAPKREHITFRPQEDGLCGIVRAEKQPLARQLLLRHHLACYRLVAEVLPEYQQMLHSPINTLRLHPADAWRQTAFWRRDDSRLHVDVFPSTPNRGERILRIFTNINPCGQSRSWRVGETFEKLAQRFLPRLGRFSSSSSWLQKAVGMTQSYRTHYDHLMLEMHDAMKGDPVYQQGGPQVTLDFPAGSSWICFSDQTPHAAMAGQFVLEQTLLLPVSGMKHPERAPLKILEKLTRTALT